MQADNDIKAQLNTETGKLEWPELQRHFARGVVLRVASGMDLVDVAVALAQDDKVRVAQWLQSGELARASEDDARRWQAQKPLFWAVVVAPWVVTQEIETPTH